MLITGADMECTELSVGAVCVDMVIEALCECSRGLRDGGSDINAGEDVLAYVAARGLFIKDGDGFDVGGRDEFLDDCC